MNVKEFFKADRYAERNAINALLIKIMDD